MLDGSGNLYGAYGTSAGGSSFNGGIFELVRGASAVTVLAPLTDPVGLAIDSRGNLYGTTFGTIFELARNSTTVTTIASFDGTNGSYPEADLTLDTSGDLFGTTDRGGAYNLGTVFELPYNSSAIDTLVSFTGANGGQPRGDLLIDSAGDLFGTTYYASWPLQGTVFEIQAGSSTLTTLVMLGAGSYSQSGLAMDARGNLYGTTNRDVVGGGSVFELSRTPFATTASAAGHLLLAQAPDHHNIEWSINGGQPYMVPINNPPGLTINGDGNNDIITLDYSDGDPLPGTLHLNGTYTIDGLSGSDPLAGTTLDLGQGSTAYLAYASAASDPLAAIKGYLQNGYNGGAWTGLAGAGTGSITSSAAAASSGQLAVGFADWGDGTGVDTVSNTIELRCTTAGDANLDGTVNLADLLALIRNFGKSDAAWDQGDFNYDGSANLSDFLSLARHFGQSQPPTLSATDLLLPGSPVPRRLAARRV